MRCWIGWSGSWKREVASARLGNGRYWVAPIFLAGCLLWAGSGRCRDVRLQRVNVCYRLGAVGQGMAPCRPSRGRAFSMASGCVRAARSWLTAMCPDTPLRICTPGSEEPSSRPTLSWLDLGPRSTSPSLLQRVTRRFPASLASPTTTRGQRSWRPDGNHAWGIGRTGVTPTFKPATAANSGRGDIGKSSMLGNAAHVSKLRLHQRARCPSSAGDASTELGSRAEDLTNWEPPQRYDGRRARRQWPSRSRLRATRSSRRLCS